MRARRRVVFLMALVAACLGACASQEARPAAGDAGALLAELAGRHHVCAAALAVVKGGKLAAIHTASGCPGAQAARPDSVFQAASLSKPVFAYAVLRLAEQGGIDLDAPLTRYLPGGYRHRFDPLREAPSDLVTDPRLDAVTARMVLNHTSGLPNWSGGPLRFDADPGTRWIYSGEGYALLQRAVEAITGQPLDQFMRSAVFKPLGMEDSDYVLNPRLARSLVPGTKVNGAPRTTLALRTPVAAFSLCTTAADYGRFLAHVLGDGALLARLRTAPVAVDPGRGLAWRLGWAIELDGEARYGEARYIWHWGNNTGYRAFAIGAVGTGDGFVVLTNSENGIALARPLAENLLPGQHRLFDANILDEGVLNWTCRSLRICL